MAEFLHLYLTSSLLLKSSLSLVCMLLDHKITGLKIQNIFQGYHQTSPIGLLIVFTLQRFVVVAIHSFECEQTLNKTLKNSY